MRLRQSYARVGKIALIQAPALRPRQAVQAREPGLRRLRTMLGRSSATSPQDCWPAGARRGLRAAALARAPGEGSAPARARSQALFAASPEVECIGKGKAHKPYEFGVKVSVATPLHRCQGRPVCGPHEGLAGQPLLRAHARHGRPRHREHLGAELDRIVTDAGDKGHNAPKDQRFKVYVAGQSEGSPPPSSARSAAAPPWSPRSVTSRTSTGWGATTWPDERRAVNAVLAAAGYNFRLS